jgi:hypothetical protein
MGTEVSDLVFFQLAPIAWSCPGWACAPLPSGETQILGRVTGILCLLVAPALSRCARKPQPPLAPAALSCSLRPSPSPAPSLRPWVPFGPKSCSSSCPAGLQGARSGLGVGVLSLHDSFPGGPLPGNQWRRRLVSLRGGPRLERARSFCEAVWTFLLACPLPFPGLMALSHYLLNLVDNFDGTPEKGKSNHPMWFPCFFPLLC